MAYKPSEMTASQIQTELGIDGRKLGQYLARIKPVKERGKFQYYLLQDVIEQIYKKPGKIIPIDEIKKKKLQAEAELVELELEKESFQRSSRDDKNLVEELKEQLELRTRELEYKDALLNQLIKQAAVDEKQRKLNTPQVSGASPAEFAERQINKAKMTIDADEMEVVDNLEASAKPAKPAAARWGAFRK